MWYWLFKRFKWSILWIIWKIKWHPPCLNFGCSYNLNIVDIINWALTYMFHTPSFKLLDPMNRNDTWACACYTHEYNCSWHFIVVCYSNSVSCTNIHYSFEALIFIFTWFLCRKEEARGLTSTIVWNKRGPFPIQFDFKCCVKQERSLPNLTSSVVWTMKGLHPIWL